MPRKAAGSAFKISDYYQPHEQQLKFHASPAKYRLFGGAKGGGKSVALIWEAINWCIRVPGCNVLLLRRTFPDLNKTLINHFETKIPAEIYGGTRSYNRNDHVVTFRNGSKLWFGACQHEHDVYDYNGGEYVFIGIDEGTEWTYKMWEFLTLQNRCPVKKDINGHPVVPCMAMATNPGGVGHDWVKKAFILHVKPDDNMSNYDATKYEFVKSSVYDNPAYRDDMNYLTTLESANPEWRARYLQGSWDVLAGLYFSRFDPFITKIDKFEALRMVRKQTWQPKWIAIDWGFQHYAAVFWFSYVTMTDREGNKFDKIVVYRELVINQTGERELAQKIANLCRYTDEKGDEAYEKIDNIYLSPDAFAKRTSQNTIAEEIGQELQRQRMAYPEMADDDRIGGARLLDEMLSARPLPDIMISDACTELLEAIPMIQREDKPSGDIEDVKKTNSKADDIYDGFRYGIKSHLESGKTPFQVERERVLSQAKTGNDKLFADLALHQKRQNPNIWVPVQRRGYGFAKPFRGR